MEYYRFEDIKRLTGYSRDKVYKIIKELKAMLKKEYPDLYTFGACIPIWYWDEKTKPKGAKKSEENEIKTVN